jgi:heme exporter protein B
VAIPVLLASVKASAGFLQGLPYSDIQVWLNILVVYDVIFTAVALMTFDFVIEE